MNNIIYITSVIHFKQKPLSYSGVRSAFSPNERLEQTIHTISSVRKYMPNAHIVLIEAGIINVGLEDIISLADTYIYAGNNRCIRRIVDSPYKGAGEISFLLYGIRKTRHMKAYYIAKISGRYWINNHFNKKEFFTRNVFSFSSHQQSYSTRLYGLFASKRKYRILILLLGLCISFANISIETIFYYLIPSSRVSVKKTLGVSGYIGVNGDIIHE